MKKEKENKSLTSILLKKCPVCKKMVLANEDRCDKCGYVFDTPKKEESKQEEVKEETINNNVEETKVEEKPQYTYSFFAKPEDVILCKKCGKEMDATAKFCINCGSKVEKEFFCISCNKKIDEGMAFCPFCGIKQEKQLSKVEKLNDNTPVETKIEEKTPIKDNSLEKRIGLEKPIKKNKKEFDNKKIGFGIVELIMILSLFSMILFVPFYIKNNLIDFIKLSSSGYYFNGIEYFKTLFTLDISSIKDSLFENSNLLTNNFISYLVFVSYSIIIILLIYRMIVIFINMFNKKEYRYFSLIIISIFLFALSFVSYITLAILKISNIDVLFIYLFIIEFILLLFINSVFNKKN